MVQRKYFSYKNPTQRLGIEIMTISKPLKYKRIAIDGTHSTGKSTLLNQLMTVDEIGETYDRIDEPVREVAPSLGVVSPEDWQQMFASQPRHLELLQKTVQRQWELERASEYFVIDGSLYKVLTYGLVVNFQIEDMTDLLPLFNYDLIIYCPLEIEFAADGFRFDNYREKVDHATHQLYQQHYRGELLPVTGSTEERVEQVLAHLTENQTQS